MMVEKGCESCRKWQEHYCWEHMDVSKIRFFKLMTGDFARGISIPEKFTENFSGRIVKGFDLKVTNGESWHVGINKRDDELFLMSGWEDFVKAHELEENDLLIFTCSGSSSFDVLIFEASGCEKASSLFGSRVDPNMRKYFDDMVGRGKQAERYSVSDSDDTTTPSRLIGSPHYASTSKKSSGKKQVEEPESPNSSNDQVKREATGEKDGDDEYANSNYYYYYYSRIADRLSDEEKEEIISLASIRSDNPAFVTVLQMSHVRRRSNFLIFPGRFAAGHLDSKLHEIILRRPNQKDKWCVKYYCAREARGIKNYNFYKFVRENKLREGDMCVFELMKGARRVTMTVHVIRKVDGRFVLVD